MNLRSRSIAVLSALVMAGVAFVPNASADSQPTHYVVGVASRSINPDADGTYAGQPVHLGGYGLGSGPVVGPILGDRQATGILGPGVTARAFIVATDNNPADALVIESIETQGSFVAYQQGPYGLEDIRKQAATATGIPVERIIVDTNHTHAGPDTIGAWGGVPTPYLAYIASQSVAAIADAWANRQDATLWLATTDASDLQSNQFSNDPNNQVMDSQMRVLQARGSGGEAVATLLNLSIHPTVMGGDNTLVSADWSGPVQQLLETKYGGGAVAVSGTLGRSQPNDGPSYAACSDQTGLAQQYCALDHYAHRVANRVEAAVADATPLTGAPVVDGHSYFIAEVAHNALLLGATVGGAAIGAPIARADTPPWATGNVVGTVTFSGRIGDILVSGGPGEMYPQIPAAVVDAVTPARTQLVVGLAGDQLGYILAPFPGSYPEPIRRSLLSGKPDDPKIGRASCRERV